MINGVKMDTSGFGEVGEMIFCPAIMGLTHTPTDVEVLHVTKLKGACPRQLHLHQMHTYDDTN